MQLNRIVVGLKTSSGDCRTDLGLGNVGQSFGWLNKKKVTLISCIPASKLGIGSSFFSSSLRTSQLVRITVGDGESYKSLSCCRSLIRLLHREGIRRGDTVLALGGGVIGDLSGFITSSYMRGIGLVHLPTTLLSQTDSSLGGKTGLNTFFGKNTIGAFFLGDGVLADVTMLKSLPEREWRSGLCEVIKVGVSTDGPFFCWLERHILRILRREVTTVLNLVKRSAETKGAVVTADGTEAGIRSVLNFGHTFGHAVELGLAYSKWSHGEAISCGMVLAIRMSERLGLVTSATKLRLFRLLSLCGLPTALPTNFPTAILVGNMRFDKKNLGTSLNVVLLRSIADPTIFPLSADQLEELLSNRRLPLRTGT